MPSAPQHNRGQLALSVQEVSKSYVLGLAGQSHDRAAEALMHRLRNPFQRLSQESFWALRDVSFDVHQGEVVGIIGRNGAGKSTLLKILSRITEPTSGRIDLYGRVGSLLEVGTGFHPDLTGRENVYLNGTFLGMTRREIQQQFDAIVDFSGVEKFLDTPVKRYSSGMYVRLAFAVAAHLNPEILIVDEVLSVGDAAFQKKCMGKMQDVASQGRTVLFVSHGMGSVRSLCGTAIWMEDGRIRQTGEVKTVTDAYMMETAADSMEGALDVRHSRRANWIAEEPLIRLCRIEFNDGEPLRHGEPMAAHIEYEVYGPVDDVAFGFGFSNLDGLRLMSTDSDLMDARRSLREGQHGVVEVRIPQLFLQPGQYLLDAGARSGDYNGVDYIPGCAQVDVLPGPTTPPSIIRGDIGVRIPSSWRWQPQEERQTALAGADCSEKF